jgi:hypothetical protein
MDVSIFRTQKAAMVHKQLAPNLMAFGASLVLSPGLASTRVRVKGQDEGSGSVLRLRDFRGIRG